MLETEVYWHRSSLIDTLSKDSGREDVTIQEFTSQDVITKDITSQDFGIAYHYCDFSDPRSLEVRNILGTIVRQLLERINISGDLEQHMNPLYGPDARDVTNDALSAILFHVIKHFSKVYLFIDGLDECRNDAQTMILSIVHQISQSEQPTVKIFVSSRDELIISASLKKFLHLRISAENNSDDIAHFVEEAVNLNIRSGALKIQDPSLQSEIITTLTGKAHGMSVAPT